MSDELIGRLPIYRRDGTWRATALVDPADWAWAQQFKWRLVGDGYVSRARYIPAGKDGEKHYQRTVYLHREIAERMGLEAETKIGLVDGNMLNCRRGNIYAMVPKGRQARKYVPRPPRDLDTVASRTCPSCQVIFTPAAKRRTQKYCSRKCQWQAQKKDDAA